VDLWFIDDKRVWSIPDDVLPQIIEQLRDSDGDVVADVIEVALETGASQVGMDDREQPTLKAAIERWASEQPGVADWVSGVIGS
jgi:hypothetical protein